MTSRERKALTTALFHEALAKPVGKRLDYLRDASAGDAGQFEKVKELLEAYAEIETALPSDKRIDRPGLALNGIDTLIDLSDRYEEIKFIGEGGMGVVFRAYDREIGKVVALKTLQPRLAADARIVERLRNETRLALEITHRSVCRIYGLERINDRFLIAMEYVDGETLRNIMDRVRGVSVPQGLVWASEICDALTAAHEKKIIHRDLKPENIMIDREGHVKVMDFGIACSFELNGDQLAESPGTPLYMSPEQRKKRPLEPTSDIYSFGLVLYELFTGVRRDPGSAIPAIAVNNYLPAHLNETIGRCLEPDPGDRYQTMMELKAALTQTQSIRDRSRLRLGVRRVRKTIATSRGLAALIALAGALGLITYFATRPTVRVHGHDDVVSTLAFSPDGRFLASGSEDKTVILWDAAAQHRIRTLVGHIRAVDTLAFSADSKWLASGSADATIQITEVSTGRVRATLRDKKQLSVVALSPDGRWLASSGDENVKIWDVLAGKVVRTMSHDDAVLSLVFSPDGRLLASGSADSTASVWEVETGMRVSGRLRHDDGVLSVTFSPDGRFLASAGQDNFVRLWSTTTWDTIQTLPAGEKVGEVVFSSDGRFLLAITGFGHIKIWRAPTWSLSATLMAEEPDRATEWTFSPDGRSLAIGDDDGRVRVQRLRLQPNP